MSRDYRHRGGGDAGDARGLADRPRPSASALLDDLAGETGHSVVPEVFRDSSALERSQPIEPLPLAPNVTIVLHFRQEDGPLLARERREESGLERRDRFGFDVRALEKR